MSKISTTTIIKTDDTGIKAPMSNVTAIKKFFQEGEHGRQVTMGELKALTQSERHELGMLCKQALGV